MMRIARYNMYASSQFIWIIFKIIDNYRSPRSIDMAR